MTEYINFWKNYINFNDRTSVRGFWMAFLFNVIVGAIVGGIYAATHAIAIYSIYSLAVLLPTLGIEIRRLRDAGYAWGWIFISCVPLVGAIWLIVLLCKPSIPDNGIPTV